MPIPLQYMAHLRKCRRAATIQNCLYLIDYRLLIFIYTMAEVGIKNVLKIKRSSIKLYDNWKFQIEMNRKSKKTDPEDCISVRMRRQPKKKFSIRISRKF